MALDCIGNLMRSARQSLFYEADGRMMGLGGTQYVMLSRQLPVREWVRTGVI
jgi:hypothetical protein